MNLIPKNRTCGGRGLQLRAGVMALAWLAFVSISPAQITVQTIGGGVRTECGSASGFAQGNTWMNSQFNLPYATALDSQGDLWVADNGNSDIELVTLAGNRTESLTYAYASQGDYHLLPDVIGVAVDGSDNLYILTQTYLYKFDNVTQSFPDLNYQFGLALSRFSAETPTALTVVNDPNTNIYISFTTGAVGEIIQIPQPYPQFSYNTIVSKFPFAPAGLTMRADGNLAVSDTLSNAIYIVPPINASTPVLVTGGNGTGLVNGAPNFAEFNQPHGIAASGDGRMVVCDTLNNCVRLIDAGFNTTTLYGTSTNVWTRTCCSCVPALYAGWVDGVAGTTGADASSRQPLSVTISSNGTLFVTEAYYSLIRSVTGAGLTPVTVYNSNNPTGNATNLPSVTTTAATAVTASGGTLNAQVDPNGSPTTVYFEWGTTTNATNTTLPTTIDADLDTTNAVAATLTGLQSGTVIYYRVVAYNDGGTTNGAVFSFYVTAASYASNMLGFETSHNAGVGSTVYIPLALQLSNGVSVTGLQFRVEVTPNSNAPPLSSLSLLPVTTNDFVQYVGPSTANLPVNYSIYPYTTSSNGQGLLILATNGSGLSIQDYGVLGLLEFVVPYDAQTNQSYSLDVLYPSGSVPNIGSMNQTLNIVDLPYLAGDSDPPNGYEASEFGDGVLTFNDVQNAVNASVGIRVPPLYSDAFNAMDVYPQTAGLFGVNGDFVIDSRDWNTILQRAVGQGTNNWIRFWTNFNVGGGLVGEPVSAPAGLVGDPVPLLAKAVVTATAPGTVWLRQAAVGADTVAKAQPGQECSVPVYLDVQPGYSISGLQFRAIVSPVGKAPPVGQAEFVAADGVPKPLLSAPGLSPNDIVTAWEYGAFNPPLQNSNYLGTIDFQIPPGAKAGQSYEIHFTGVDGAPDIDTTYALESFPGRVWVLSNPLQKASITSDEWKMHFFGSVTATRAQDDADPDRDGAPNWREYLEGTDPTNALSVLRLDNKRASTDDGSVVTLSWLTAPGKTYILESMPAVGGVRWTAISTNVGDGYTYEITENNSKGHAKLYRLLLQP